jgi:hypothetical protein
MFGSAKYARVRPRMSKPKRLMILRKSKAIRRWLLRNPWVRPMCVFNFAAIRIQQYLRGFIQRRRQLGEMIGRSVKPMKRKAGNKQLDRYLSYMDKCRKQLVSKPTWLDEGFSSWCAVRIQSLWRMHRAYKKRMFGKRLVNQVACIIIQTAWRNHIYRSRVAGLNDLRQPVILDVYVAAQIIQLCWRQHCNRRIYRYFRDLVTKQLKGAPYDLLRSVIPTESHLLDRASGVHVRFRLGGRVFPPKVYFKIYTHRPLCDVNSFAPRNYVNERPADPAQVLNRSSTVAPKTGTGKVQAQALRVGARYFGAVVKTTSVKGTADWYKRDENNDWRPIASHMFENIATPPWFREVAHTSKARPFHFSKLRREEDLRKARKKRRRQWMVKAYLFATTAAATALVQEAEVADVKHPTTADVTGRSSPLQAKLSGHWTGTADQVTSPYAAGCDNTPVSFRYADTKHETASNIIASYYRQSAGQPSSQGRTADIGRNNAGPSAETKAEPKSLRAAAADFKRSFADSEADSKSASSGSLLSRRQHSGGGGLDFKSLGNNNLAAQEALRSSYLQQRTGGVQSTAEVAAAGRWQIGMALRAGSPPGGRGRPAASDGIADIVDWR